MKMKLSLTLPARLRLDYDVFVALFLNLSLVFQFLGAILVLLLGREPGWFTLFQKTAVAAFLVLAVAALLWRGAGLLLLTGSAIWLALHVGSYFIEPRITILLVRIVIYSYGYVLLTACLIARIKDPSALIRAMKPFIPVSLLYAVVQLLVFRKTGLYSMPFSYATVPSAILCLLFWKKEKKYLFLFLLIALVDLICGSRGCFLCFLLAVLLSELMQGKKGFRILWLALLALAFLLVLVNISAIAGLALKLFPGSRTVQILASGEFHLSGREAYYTNLLNIMRESGFAPHGLYSDRFVMATYHARYSMEEIFGSYAHNFLIEVLFQFGWIGFPLLILFFISLFVSYGRVRRCGDAGMIRVWIIAVSYSMGQLLVSSSYLTAISFGMLLGVMLLSRRLAANGRLRLPGSYFIG